MTIGYYYVAVDGSGNPLSTLWSGIPDYLADGDGSLVVWELKNFGHLGIDPNGDYDCDGTNNLQEYLNGADPNKIQFSISVANQFVNSSPVPAIVTVSCGAPSSIAMLVDSTNFSGATWNSYTTSNLSISIGSTPGPHDIWVGLRGLSSDAHQTWDETTVVLDSVAPSITITNPADNISFNSSRVNICGNFTCGSLQQITVNGVLAFANGTNFEARNVPLTGGTNVITAVVQDFDGDSNTASVNIIGLTNSDGTMNDPIELQASTVGGFYPLAVTFSVQTNYPGALNNVFYDFDGDGIADFDTNNFSPLTYTYPTNGQFFPVVTVQTSLGRFSSLGGWYAGMAGSTNGPLQINVQATPLLVSSISITDPIDIKWTASSNLYTLSGSTATITEFDSTGTSIRSLSGIGSNPSGLDVDAAGNVYVAMTGSNQVWRFYPTNSTFAVDTAFGTAGYIGLTNGASGARPGQFNAPYDVAVSPDGSIISVSDSDNNQIQQFDTNGNFLAVLGGAGTNLGQFNTPEGLAYDSLGTLYIVDSGNNRIVLSQSIFIEEVTGTGGTALGQFNGPVNVGCGTRGIYVADTANNRIQKFNLTPPGQFSITSGNVGYAITNLNQPASVAAVTSLTNEMFYIADTGNDRVLLYSIPADNPLPVWTNMTASVVAGNIPAALSCFSIASSDEYRQAFLTVGTANTISLISDIGTLTPVYIQDDRAEYYFQRLIAGQTITFPVEFDKENGMWKILEF